jgi:hypothetical protein
MKTSTRRLRWPWIAGAAVGAASLATACSQRVGADFNVTLGSTASGAGGSGGGAVSSNSSSSIGGGGSVGSSGSTGTGGSGGAGGNGCGGVLCLPETVAANQDFPWGLVVEGTSVYWTVAGASFGTNILGKDGAIRRRGIDGGDVETVLDLIRTPDQIASDGEYLYWTSTVPAPNGAVHRCLITGCVRENVALGQDSPTGITVRGAYVYWASSGNGTVSRRLRDQQVDGGAPIEVVATGRDHPNLVVSDADGVYFTEFSPTGSVWRIGDDLMPTAFAQAMDTPAGLVARVGDVCVTTYNAAGVVQCVDKVTHEASLTAAVGQDHPAELAGEGKALYWANNIDHGQIMRWRPGDLAPIALAVDQPFPNGIVVAGKWVYWTNNVLAGSVMRALKD